MRDEARDRVRGRAVPGNGSPTQCPRSAASLSGTLGRELDARRSRRRACRCAQPGREQDVGESPDAGPDAAVGLDPGV